MGVGEKVLKDSFEVVERSEKLSKIVQCWMSFAAEVGVVGIAVSVAFRKVRRIFEMEEIETAKWVKAAVMDGRC